MPPQAPVEIWHKILKYTISVPLFLDPNPTETYGIDSIIDYSWESSYWEAERTRHSLRVVCKSWDIFLKRYAHRFVNMTDVCHGMVPDTVLPFAIRISLRLNLSCGCEAFCTGTEPRTVLKSRVMERLEKAIVALGNLYGPDMMWNLEILSEQLTKDRRELELLRHRAPRLSALVNNETYDLSINNTFAESLNVLSIDDIWDWEPIIPAGVLRLSNLTTLYLSVPSLDFYFKGWSLPSLKHLSIDWSTRSSDTHSAVNKLLEMLEQVGEGLETLYFRKYKPESIPVPQRLWKLCPRLLRVQMPCNWAEMPPLGHPVRCFRISMHASDYRENITFE
jgi:hypothetical protein